VSQLVPSEAGLYWARVTTGDFANALPNNFNAIVEVSGTAPFFELRAFFVADPRFVCTTGKGFVDHHVSAERVTFGPALSIPSPVT
jgi:hypothetical protein